MTLLPPIQETPDDAVGFYTTDALPPGADRERYWRDAWSRTFGPVSLSVADQTYSGTIRAEPLGPLRTVIATGDRLSVRRDLQHIAAGTENGHVVVNVLVAGLARVEQDGRSNEFGPGDVVIYDTARPLRLDIPQSFQAHSLVVRRDDLGLSERQTTHITATALGPGTPVGTLMSSFLTRVVGKAGELVPHVRKMVARTTLDMLAALADERIGTAPDLPPAPGNRVLLVRIQTFINEHFADPALSPAMIARAHHISLRYLHKLFEKEGTTVNGFVRQRRLEESRRELLRNPHRTITAVAHQNGFASTAHFSRTFRAQYGVSPIEWRAAHQP
ncbi:helix-turn-helix domain-containing protein [Streptomyces lavenduligriseus]|uniref:Helix-turn-helix domain-containing protein n=1 Tax=Streptomyces lavenduligriseus TaxID=67315 RepID=A0ABT0NTG0_9ACTN|nr:helix-turn-helix domain-containing protein [Streptomyces lavenduligriseus]MCL3994734.1 helix-turn-helix domain-containing protein [Streptomyces lavenduligriseus]